MTTEYNEMIIVSDWEKVEADDFYLTDEWDRGVGDNHDSIVKARELQANEDLFIAYIIPAVHYAIYTQMDASQVFIDEDGHVVLDCESAVIGNKHDWRQEYSY